MRVTSIKNIIIGALAVINLFFLGFFLWQQYSDQSYRTQTHKYLSTLMAQNGIEMDIENIHDGDVMYELTTTRSEQWERATAEALLGETTMTDQGGNIASFTGDKGQAVFWSGGEFAVTFLPGTYMVGLDAVNASYLLLKTMSIDADKLDLSTENGTEKVTASCTWKGYEIFNNQIVFVFQNNSLIEISGKHAAGIASTSNKVDMTSASTALMNFLRDVKKGLYACTTITAVEPGYQYISSGSLKPVWRIETDSGVYYDDTAAR